MTDVRSDEFQPGELARLFKEFGREYGESYARLAAELQQSHPELVRAGRRTGRALRNICFFVWSYARNGDERFIPALFEASVLLSAQDDFYDNPRIPGARKKSFCLATNAFIQGSTPPSDEPDEQVRALTALWSRVAGPVRAAPPSVHSFWQDKACRMNVTMEAENRILRSGTVTFDRYMENAAHSIGMVFLWSTYLVHKRVPLSTLHALDPVILRGARIVRMCNDIASFRQGKRTNGVMVLGGGRSAEGRVRELIASESRAFRKQLRTLRVGSDIERVMLGSVEFLKEFYRRSDFDKRTFR